MSVRPLSALCVLLLLLPCAPVPRGQEQTTSLEDVIARHVAARGGRARWEQIRSIRRTARLGTLQILTIWAGDRARVEQSDSELERYEYKAAVGPRGWVYAAPAPDQRPRDLSDAEVRDLRESAALGFELLVPERLGLRLELMGREPFQGTPAWKIAVKGAAAESWYLFLDVNTLLEAGRLRARHGPQGAEMHSTPMHDHRPVEGFLLAHAIGTMRATYLVNEELRAELFEKPYSR